jgi:non-lysosomal glucosylceramidase
MAVAMGEEEKSREYTGLFDSGSKKYDTLLWNGEYFDQKVSVNEGLRIPDNLAAPAEAGCDTACSCKPEKTSPALGAGRVTPKYQYGSGCLADQLLGQYLAHVAGLGYVLDPAHVKRAMQSIAKNNFKTTMSSVANVQRVYALNDEAGLLLCTWPKGDRPALPFPYSDEVWTGIEYQVAASLIYEGQLREGLAVVRAARDRYNGLRRNPWDEEECGHHYARAMSSWALLLALSGFQYDGVSGAMSFAPATGKGEFSSFWSCGTGWGTIQINASGGARKAELKGGYGKVRLESLGLPGLRKAPARVSLRGAGIESSCDAKGVVRFARPIELKAGDLLTVAY